MSTTRHPPGTWAHPLQRGVPPAWASEWGEDRLHGPWCAINVGDVVQRLRWIPPGVFWMGSPEDEEGRFPDEGPRQLMSIESGFWIFDTPCTQGLWEAVMGANPSRFKVADHPVESVSWQECQEFLTSLNSRLDGLQLSLPSEAQWEYSCRAGTGTARYSENLDGIAWYGANSGRQTHSVGSKEANSWGLYDTLGNVREWCADVWADDYSDRARASASESPSARRVVRGGSWLIGAQGVRAAFRDRQEPSARGVDLGFRCAEFRPGSRAEGARGAWRRGRSTRQPATRRAARGAAEGLSRAPSDAGAPGT